ncbi:MAG: deoxyribose-phosphate aldolase [Planctomycetaceae bacterium]
MSGCQRLPDRTNVETDSDAERRKAVSSQFNATPSLDDLPLLCTSYHSGETLSSDRMSRYRPHGPNEGIDRDLRFLTAENISTKNIMDYTYADIAKMIDHSLLNPTLSAADLEAGCRLAVAYDVASVCIMPFALRRCVDLLKGSTVKASTTIGFPHGGHTTEIKRAEAERAIADGCEELDMVVNISQVLSGQWDYVRADIQAVIEVAHAAGQKVKVIFENCYLNDAQKIELCRICSDLNADWVKTSTGYGTGGATHDDLKLMREHSAPHVQVKAAGGVRDLDGLLAVRALGVSRCGASRTKDMLDEARRRLNLPVIEQFFAAQSSGY